jgi:hypothetical protein
MPVINLVNYPFADGTTPTGTEISEVFYLPAAVPVSLEGINGWLDKQNADASFTEVTYDQVQENSFHYADTAAGTASLDYFKTWWDEIGLSIDPPEGVTPPQPTDYLDRFKPIPGGGKTFYLPYDCLVIFTWTISWGCDSRRGSRDIEEAGPPIKDSRSRPGADAWVGLWVNDTHVAGQLRQASRSLFTMSPVNIGGTWRYEAPGGPIDWTLNDTVHMGMVKNRYWNGHYTTQLEAGWHSVSLRILGNGRGIADQYAPQESRAASGPTTGFKYDVFRQARVWARSMRYIALRRKVEG